MKNVYSSFVDLPTAAWLVALVGLKPESTSLFLL
jgi:hypothetical protein